MSDNLKNTENDYLIGTENVSKYTPTIIPEKENYFEQFVMSDVLEGHPILRRVFKHWTFDFSSQILAVLIWLVLFVLFFGFSSLIAFLIPMSAVLAITIVIFFTDRRF
jgi:hypothetical protein